MPMRSAVWVSEWGHVGESGRGDSFRPELGAGGGVRERALLASLTLVKIVHDIFEALVLLADEVLNRHLISEQSRRSQTS